MLRIIAPACLLVSSAAASAPPGCTGSSSLGAFRILVRRSAHSTALPLKVVSSVPAGARLIWDPIHLTPRAGSGAEVAAILVPDSGGDLVALRPQRALAPAEWEVTRDVEAIALVYGPHGLSAGKVRSLVAHDPELVAELANYAEQTSRVESLVQELADSEQSSGGADAALKGFSSRYGVALPKLDTKSPPNQQATALLGALLPAATAYDPLGARGAQMQQSGGLAASVAGLFFGNVVVLAAGGATLFQNVKNAMFPGTEFRSAFAQTNDGDGLALCTKTQGAKTRTRLAYLWAYRVPDTKPPVVKLVGPLHLPLGSKSALRVTVGAGSSLKDLARAREWRLVPAAGGSAVPVGVAAHAPDSIELDLSQAKAPAGDYRLEATWDWDALEIAGTLHLHPYGDFSHVRLPPESRDRLIEGNGVVTVKASGADFEFLERVAVEKAGARPSSPIEVHFSLPEGKRGGPQDSMSVDIGTAARGDYRLLLTQSDGVSHAVPFTVLPPDPKLNGLPVVVNTGEARQAIRLHGTGLDRILSVASEAGEITGKGDVTGWCGEIRLNREAAAGQRYTLVIAVKGLTTGLTVPDAIQVEGPRPRITAVRKSVPADLGIKLREDELPRGVTLGLALSVEHLHDESGGSPAGAAVVRLGCGTGESRPALSLSPGDRTGAARLTVAGPGILFLSLDAGSVGDPGCRLMASVSVTPEGRSDPYPIGRVVRIPRLEQFTLTTERVGPSSYAGILKGADLDVVEKVGWDGAHGLPVSSIPTPAPGDGGKQTLRVVLPWPAPAPHAPLYVWLQGEESGRETSVTY